MIDYSNIPTYGNIIMGIYVSYSCKNDLMLITIVIFFIQLFFTP